MFNGEALSSLCFEGFDDTSQIMVRKLSWESFCPALTLHRVWPYALAFGPPVGVWSVNAKPHIRLARWRRTCHFGVQSVLCH